MIQLFKLFRYSFFCIGILLCFSFEILAQNFEWVHQRGPENVLQTHIKFDSLGNFYSVGTFQNKIDFDPDTGSYYLESSPTHKADMFIRKFNTHGKLLWAKRIGGPETERLMDFEIDGKGNLYITGSFTNYVDFDPDTSTYINNVVGNKTYHDIFCAKYDSAGKIKWAINLGTGPNDHGRILAVDKKGNVYVNGLFTGSLDFDLDTGKNILVSQSQQYDIFTMKLDSMGRSLWAVNYYAWSTEDADDMVADDQENLYTLGHFRSQIDLDPGPNVHYAKTTVTGYDDVFIQKLDSNGKYVWHKSFGSDSIERGLNILLNDSNQIACFGTFTDSCDFDPNAGKHQIKVLTPQTDMFNVVLTDSGTFVRAHRLDFDDAHSQYSSIAASTTLNAHYKSSSYKYLIDCDPGLGVSSLSSIGVRDIFIQKLNDSGRLVWDTHIETKSNEEAYQNWVDPFDNVYIQGLFYEPMDFDPGPGIHKLTRLTPLSTDGFLLKLSQDSCSNMTIYIDSLKDNSCMDKSYCSVAVETGKPPFSYRWSNDAGDTTAILRNQIAGFYEVTVSDAMGCNRTRKVQIKGQQNLPKIDLEPFVITNGFQAGKETQLVLVGTNRGCSSIHGKMEILLDTALSFQAASIVPDSILGQRLVWLFKSMNSGSKPFEVVLNVLANGVIQIGDEIEMVVNMSSAQKDDVPTNNHKSYFFFADNKQNDIEIHVEPMGLCSARFIDTSSSITYLYYIQNNQVSPVEHLYLIDSLSSLLDPAHFEILAMSHDFIQDLSNDSLLFLKKREFKLLPSKSNLLESIAYVVFRTKANKSIVDNSILRNTMHVAFNEQNLMHARILQNQLVYSNDTGVVHVNLGSDTGYCRNDKFNLELNAGDGLQSYKWQDGSAKSTLEVQKKGKYFVHVVDANGCTGYDELIVTEHPLPTINLGKDTTFCDDGNLSILLDAGFGYSYKWSNGTTNQNIIVNTGGTYSCTVTNPQRCIGSDEITLHSNPSPKIDLGEDIWFCADSSLNKRISAGPGASLYEWNNGQTDSAIWLKKEGNYIVEVWSEMGCTSSDSIMVKKIALPIANIGLDTSFCEGESFSITLKNIKQGYLQVWNNGSTDDSINVDSAGFYWLHVLDSNNCSNIDTVVVSQHPAPVFDLGEEIILNPSLAVDTIIGVSGEFDRFLWSDGSDDSTLHITDIGLYTLQVFSAEGCSSKDSVVVRYWKTGSILEDDHSFVRISPNPTRGNLVVQMAKPHNSWMLRDASGRHLETGYCEGTSMELKLGSYDHGMYILTILLAEGAMVHQQIMLCK